MSTWHIGGAFSYPDELLTYCLHHISQFVVYDSIPMLAWNGGRIPSNNVLIPEFNMLLAQYAQCHVPVDVPFSNTGRQDKNFMTSVGACLQNLGVP